MSAFGGKADIPLRGNPLLRSLLGVKRTWVGAAHMSAFDPKRTCPLRREYLSDAAFRAPNLAPCFLFEAQKRSRWHGTKIQLPAFSSPAPPEPAAQSTAPKAHGEMWRSSKLIGLNVYNDQDEKLGAISEILLEKSGKVDFVVIGVGGFLGIGQQDIMVEMSKLKFVDEPVRISTPPQPGSATTGTATRPPTATTTTTPTTKSKWYPDHAVLSGATKESLKNMAEFKYD